LKRKERKKLNIESTENKYIFKIQIKSATKPISKNSSEFMEYNENKIEEQFIDGRYKYTVGNSNNYNEIVEQLNEIKSIFPDAFVVAFKNGNQVSVSDAINGL